MNTKRFTAREWLERTLPEGGWWLCRKECTDIWWFPYRGDCGRPMMIDGTLYIGLVFNSKWVTEEEHEECGLCFIPRSTAVDLMEQAKTEIESSNTLIMRCCRAVPCGNVPLHTPESLPDRIRGLANEVGELSHLNDEADKTIARMTRELAEAQAVVEKCPKTADGKPVTVGMEVWVDTGAFEDFGIENRGIVQAAIDHDSNGGYDMGPDVGTEDWAAVWTTEKKHGTCYSHCTVDCAYSTREAALAWAEAKKGTQ